MIFENIDKFIEQLDLQNRIVMAESRLNEVEKENQRLVEENERKKRQIETQNIFFKQRKDRSRRLDDFYSRLDQQQRDFMSSLDGSNAKDIVRGWMRNPRNAPGFFNDWLKREKTSFLYSVIIAPFTWDDDLKRRITESLKQLNL